MNLNRRKILIASAVAGGTIASYSAHRGIRLPGLHWEPNENAKEHQVDASTSLNWQDLILRPLSDVAMLSFRATAPEPILTISSTQTKILELDISNIISSAILVTQHVGIEETRLGSTRKLKLEVQANQELQLRWQLPEQTIIKFGAIGDTGGGKELLWCIDRAHQLGCQFLLHLGDFNYQRGDYQRSIEAFNSAPLPIYVSIGNHDFHENGRIYQQFLEHIGPLNNSFSLNGVRFLNVDTAANFLPYHRGLRGELLRSLKPTKTIAFTHRPMVDPDSEAHHDLGSAGERNWLASTLKALGTEHYLAGHIHIRDRRTFEGLDQIIAGQGLGHQDLLAGENYSSLVVGSIDQRGNIEMEFEDLNMPMGLHCHPRVDPVKDSLRGGPRDALMSQIDELCKA